MGVFQELITRLTLDPSGYTHGAGVVVHDTHQAIEAIDELLLKAKEAGAGFGERFGIGEVIAPIIAIATAGGILEFGKHALEVSKDFDVLERHIQGVTQSASRMKAIMAFSEKESGKYGLASPEELAAVAAQLETMKLKTEEYLPVLEKLAAISPEGASSMKGLAEAFALIEQGQGARAIKELIRLGVTYEAMEKHGVRFSGMDNMTGMRQMLSNPKDALRGISGAVDDIGGPVLQQMLNSPEAKAQRFENAMNQAFRSAGNSIRSHLLPYMEGAEHVIDRMVEEGSVSKVVEEFMELFSIDPKNIEGSLDMIFSTVEKIPGQLRIVKDEFMQWWPAIQQGAEILAALWVADKVTAFGAAVVEAFSLVTAAVTSADAAEAMFDGLTGNLPALAAGTLAAAGAYEVLSNMIKGATESMKHFNTEAHKGETNKERIEKRAEIMKIEDKIHSTERDIAADTRYGSAFDKDRAKNEAKLKKLKAERDEAIKAYEKMPLEAKDKPGDDSKLGSTSNPQVPLLMQIAQNTHEMVKGLQRSALAGGDLGREGVNAVELAGMRGSAGRKLMQAMHEYFEGIYVGHQANLMRQGIR